jgi:hypothetical protein
MLPPILRMITVARTEEVLTLPGIPASEAAIQ